MDRTHEARNDIDVVSEVTAVFTQWRKRQTLHVCIGGIHLQEAIELVVLNKAIKIEEM
jgi:hypothetical protein